MNIDVLRKGGVLAAEIVSLIPDGRAWLGIYPVRFHFDRRPVHMDWGVAPVGDYRIRVFDVAAIHLLREGDVWDGTMDVRLDAYVSNEDLLRSVVELFVSPDSLGFPYECGYPG